MKVINYNNEAQFEALQLRLHNRLNAKSKELKYVATRYANPRTRTDGTVDLLVDDVNLPEIYAEILAELTPTEINNMEDYDSSKYPEDAL